MLKLTEDEIRRLRQYGVKYPWYPQNVLPLLDRLEKAEKELQSLEKQLKNLNALYQQAVKGGAHFKEQATVIQEKFQRLVHIVDGNTKHMAFKLQHLLKD